MNTSPSNHSGRATVVLVDPTAPDGTTSLDALSDADDHVLLVVLTTGRASYALRERAHELGTSVTSAAWSYLERLAVGLSRPGRVVGTIVAAGPDPAFELATVVAEHPTDRIVLPSSAARTDRMLSRRLARTTPVAVVSTALLSA